MQVEKDEGQGLGRGPRVQIEKDEVQVLSGVRYGLTMGSPIALLIPNAEAEAWQKAMAVEAVPEPAEPLTRPRPGHADLAGALTYGFQDLRPVMERASARETAARVAPGARARTRLAQF